MKTWKGLITSVAIASLTLLSHPGVSFALDCSYGGVFDPPLPDDGVACLASGSLTAHGGLFIAANNALFVNPPGATLGVTEEPQGFPPTFIPGSLTISGGIVGTTQPILSEIGIHVPGQINNVAGVLNLIAPTDPVNLRAGKGISLQGNPAITNPSTLIIGDTVELETTRGDITLDNTWIVSWGDNANVRLVAPRGNITLTNNSILFVLQNGVETGECTFQVKKNGGIVSIDATSGLVCIQVIKK
jgi:hypothetical protein